jgi:formate hydrogenlyase subunit 6/NADH:ubiquinone oxidoreductase subunit I
LKKGANSTYFGNIKEGIKTSMKGLSLTWKHFKDARQSRKPIFVDNPDYFKQQTGIVTLQYPHQHLPLPDNGRYQLHNEMDDCIVCDKCAKVCPVDCIEIEPIKATGIAGYASDGSAIRLYAAKFDIDMSKCMFCGLCTTVCPTECLTMTSEYDFSTFDITTHNFEFGNLTPEQSQEKRELYEQFVAEKEALKQLEVSSQQSAVGGETIEETPKPKPAFKPSFKPKVAESQEVVEKTEEVVINEQLAINNEQSENVVPKSKPVFKPSFKPKATESQVEPTRTTEIPFRDLDKVGVEIVVEDPKPKPVFKPSFKPKVAESQEVVEKIEEVIPETPKPKPAFKPSFKPKATESQVEPTRTMGISFRDLDKVGEEVIAETPKPKPVFKPSFKPKPIENKGFIEDKVGEEKVAETPKPKPVFKPTFKPKPKAEDTNN